MAKKKLTANQQAYLKEINRIKRFYKSAEKRGYRFDKKISFDIPSRVTKKSIENIKAIKPRKLYKQATYLDPVSGKLVTGTEGRTIEARQAYYKGREKIKATQYYDTSYDYDYDYSYSPPSVIDEVLNNADEILQRVDIKPLTEAEMEIENWTPPDRPWSQQFTQIKENDRDQASTLLQGAVMSEGREAVARRIEENSSEFMHNLGEILYGQSGDKKDGINPNLLALHRILYGRSPTQEEAEELTTLTEYQPNPDPSFDIG